MDPILISATVIGLFLCFFGMKFSKFISGLFSFLIISVIVSVSSYFINTNVDLSKYGELFKTADTLIPLILLLTVAAVIAYFVRKAHNLARIIITSALGGALAGLGGYGLCKGMDYHGVISVASSFSPDIFEQIKENLSAPEELMIFIKSNEILLIFIVAIILAVTGIIVQIKRK